MNQYIPVETLPQGSQGRTRDKVAEQLGMSGRTLSNKLVSPFRRLWLWPVCRVAGCYPVRGHFVPAPAQKSPFQFAALALACLPGSSFFSGGGGRTLCPITIFSPA